jgi:hypothetical protein
MSIVFAINGTSLDAVRSGGGKTGMAFGTTAPAVVVDATAIHGSSIQWAANNNPKCVSWPGRSNTPNGRTISVIDRFRPNYSGTPGTTHNLFSVIGGAGKNATLEVAHQSTTGNVIAQVRNEAGTLIVNNVSFGAWSPTSGTWYDLVLTWDGTNTANSLKFYIDAVLLGSGTTPGGSFNAGWTNQYFSEINLGTGNIGGVINGGRVEEFVIDDTIIDPSSYPLNSGNGALNGASRTSPIAVTAFDGANYVYPSAGDIRSTAVGLVNAGVAVTPTLVVPSLANTKIGVVGDGGTGTYDGSDRWTAPSAGDLRSGVQLKNNSTTLNLTGTAAIPTAANVRSGTATDNTTGTLAVPSVSNVRNGIAVDNTTGTLVVPSLANTKIGVAGDGGTGTYDGSDRWTDIAESKVELGYAYKANSTTNNKTGTLAASEGVTNVMANAVLTGPSQEAVLEAE